MRDAEAEIMKERGGGKVQMGDGAGSSKLDKLGEGGGKSSGTSDTKTPQGNREAPASAGKRPTLNTLSDSGGGKGGGDKKPQTNQVSQPKQAGPASPAKQANQTNQANQANQNDQNKPNGKAPGGQPQKEPPKLPSNQREPLNRTAQQLFGVDEKGKPQTRREQELSRLAANHPRPKVDELGNMKKPPAPPKQG